MAAVRKSGHKGLKASQRETEREEQPPPKCNKRTQSIAGIFEGVRSTRRKLAEENDASIAQVTRAGHAGDDFFMRFTTKKQQAENHPVYLAFRDASRQYEEKALANGATEVEPVYVELVNRINRFDINGRPIEVPGLPSDAEIDTLDAVNLLISKPLGEETIELRVRRKDGVEICKSITLDATLKAFREHFEKKRGELADLERQLCKIDDELESAHDDAVADKDGAIERAENVLHADLATVTEKMELYKSQTGADVKKMQKEDKVASSEVGRKVQDFLKALQ